jgi:peptidoglycan/xylan/chitin deacetylase (PgdA/CDA1 family)
MKTRHVVLGFFCLMATVIQAADGQPIDSIRVARYHSDKTCAISYTFDDGLKEHYTLVFPKFKQLGFNGTFWINGNTINQGEQGLQADKPRTTWVELQEMAAQGQEISNHGWSHRSLPRISTEEVRVEIDRNDSIIEAKIGSRPVTYCYAGNAKNAEVVRMATEHRVGTRTEQFSVGGKSTSENLERRIDTLLANRGWGVTMTHGITYGYDAFKSDSIFWDHLEKVKKLEDKIWIGTFREVAAYIAEQKNIVLKTTIKKNQTIVVPQLTLDKSLFNQPLTLVAYVSEPSRIKAVQRGKILNVAYSGGMALIEFDPNGGKITLSTKRY